MSERIQMIAALRQGAKMRGTELSADQIEGYLHVLGGASPVAVFDALAGLWRDADTKSMPAPGQIRARVRDDARAAHARAQLPDVSWHDDQDRRQIQEHIDAWKAASPVFRGQG